MFIYLFLFQESPLSTPNQFNSIFRFIPQYPDFNNFVPQYVPQYPTRGNEIPTYYPRQPLGPPVFHGNDYDDVPSMPGSPGVATEQDDMNGIPDDSNRVDGRNVLGQDEPVDKSVEFVYNPNNYNPYYG